MPLGTSPARKGVIHGPVVLEAYRRDTGRCVIRRGQFALVENVKFAHMVVRIEYTGKVARDEIRFARPVGESAAEERAAKRVK